MEGTVCTVGFLRNNEASRDREFKSSAAPMGVSPVLQGLDTLVRFIMTTDDRDAEFQDRVNCMFQHMSEKSCAKHETNEC